MQSVENLVQMTMNKKIMLIDDNPHILEAIELILTTEDYQVHSLTRVDNILKDVKLVKPALILLDLLLSGRNGKEVAATLKTNKDTQHIPIVIISAHPGAEKAAMQAGVDGFLAKPFDISDLLQLVEKFTTKNHTTVASR